MRSPEPKRSRASRRPGYRFAIAFVLLAALLPSWTQALAAAPCPPGDSDYPPFYSSSDLFDRAIEKVADYPPSNIRLSGITVPHHLLADRLVALGFRAASGQSYKRIVILTPDHFRKADKPFATTRRGFETVNGKVATDAHGR